MLIDFESIVRIHFSLREKDTSTYLVGTLVWFWAIWKCNGSETRDCRHPMWRCTLHWSLEPDWLGTRCLSISELIMWQKGYDEFWHSCVSLWGFGIRNTYKGPWCGFCKWRSCQRGCLHTERIISIDVSYLPHAQSATAFHFLISNFFDVSTIFRLFNLIF